MFRVCLLASSFIASAVFAADGEALFNGSCAACHQRDGMGSVGLAPPLVDSELWNRLGSTAGSYIQGVMLSGLSGSIEVEGQKYVGLVMPSQARMTDEELAAIGIYVLSTLNGITNPQLSATTVATLRASPPTHAALRAGRSASSNYVQYCSGCHGVDGRGGGVNSGIPDFKNFVGAFASDDGGRTYVLHVPGVVNTSLDNAEIAAVINYLMRTWGGTSLSADFVEFTPDEVQTRRTYDVPDVVSLRRQVVERLHANGIATAPYPWP